MVKGPSTATDHPGESTGEKIAPVRAKVSRSVEAEYPPRLVLPYICVHRLHCMIIDKLKELQATRAKLAALELALGRQRDEELAGLPRAYGFDSADAFIEAVRAATGGGTAKRRGRPARVSGRPAAGAKKGRRRRARITDETRSQVKKLVNEGKTGGAIAKELGISLPSVQNIKKALGMVKKRGK